MRRLAKSRNLIENIIGIEQEIFQSICKQPHSILVLSNRANCQLRLGVDDRIVEDWRKRFLVNNLIGTCIEADSSL